MLWFLQCLRLRFCRGHKWYGTEKEQAEAYRHILRILMNSVQESLSDKDFPYFYEINPFSKSGMDNADQRYLSVLINGAGVYALWGHKGTGYPFLFMKKMPSKTLAALNADDMEIAPDGSFELILVGRKLKATGCHCKRCETGAGSPIHGLGN